MSTRWVAITLVVVAALVNSRPTAVRARDLDLGVDVRAVLQGVLERNTLNTEPRFDPAASAWDAEGYLRLDRSRAWALAWASATLSLQARDSLFAAVTLDPGLLAWRPEPVSATLEGGATVPTTEDRGRFTLDGMPPLDSLRRGLGLREAYLELDLGPEEALTLGLGKRRTTLQEGWLYDDYGFGASLDLDTTPWWSPGPTLHVGALLPGRYWTEGTADTPLVEGRLGLEWSPLEAVSMGGGYLWDRAGALSRLALRAASDDALEQGDSARLAAAQSLQAHGESSLAWLDLAATVAAGPVLLSGRAVMQWGSTGVADDTGGPARQVALRGWGAGLGVQWPAARRLAVDAFLMWLSGDQPPDLGSAAGGERSWGTFLSLVPFVRHTALFFDGGLNSNLASRQASLLGVGGRGVLGGGAGATWSLRDGLLLHGVVAVLGSDAAAPFTGGRLYGVETDLDLVWEAQEWLDLGLEADLLVPSSFYRDDAPVTRVTVGCDAHF